MHYSTNSVDTTISYISSAFFAEVSTSEIRNSSLLAVSIARRAQTGRTRALVLESSARTMDSLLSIKAESCFSIRGQDMPKNSYDVNLFNTKNRDPWIKKKGKTEAELIYK